MPTKFFSPFSFIITFNFFSKLSICPLFLDESWSSLTFCSIKNTFPFFEKHWSTFNLSPLSAENFLSNILNPNSLKYFSINVSKASPNRISWDCNKFCKILAFGFVGLKSPIYLDGYFAIFSTNAIFDFSKSHYINIKSLIILWK